jgi:hypothetical protein
MLPNWQNYPSRNSSFGKVMLPNWQNYPSRNRATANLWFKTLPLYDSSLSKAGRQSTVARKSSVVAMGTQAARLPGFEEVGSANEQR